MKRKFIKVISLIFVFAILFTSVFSLDIFSAPVITFDTDPVPVNKNANQTCKNFYQYMCNVRKSGGLISGAVSNRIIGINGTTADAENDYHQYIKDIFGVTPVIMGNHLDYKTISNDDIDVLSSRYKQGAIPMFQFGAGDSSKLGSEKKNGIVNFDKTNKDRDEEMYQSYVNDLKLMGEFFKSLENSGVEVYILRLYIENNNSSKQGFYGTNYIGYDAFKRVWKDAVDYLTNKVGLTGILIAYAPAGFSDSKEYYPGADCVDINCPTVYANASDGEIFTNSDCADYSWMKEEPRPFGFSELAARSVLQPGSTRPIGDYSDTLDTLLHCYPELSFFVLWYENVFSIEPTTGSSTIGNYNGEYFIKNPKVIVAENALNYRTTNAIKSTGVATLYTKENSSVSLQIGDYSASALKNLKLDLSKINTVDVMFGCAVKVYDTADLTGSPKIYFGKTENILSKLKNAKSVSVVKLSNIALDKDVWADNDDSSVYKVNNGKNDKFITESANADGSLDITIDLGQKYLVGAVSLNLAGFYEDNTYNISDFAIYTSKNDVKYTMVYKAIANIASSVNVYFDAVNSQYIKLRVLKANNSTSAIEKQRISIADIMVYGVDDVALSSDDSDIDTVFEDGLSENIGNISEEYGDEMTEEVSTQGSEIVKKPKTPKYEIPKFNNYIWIFICAGFLVISGIFWLVLLLLLKRKHRNKKQTARSK